MDLNQTKNDSVQSIVIGSNDPSANPTQFKRLECTDPGIMYGNSALHTHTGLRTIFGETCYQLIIYYIDLLRW